VSNDIGPGNLRVNVPASGPIGPRAASLDSEPHGKPAAQRRLHQKGPTSGTECAVNVLGQRDRRLYTVTEKSRACRGPPAARRRSHGNGGPGSNVAEAAKGEVPGKGSLRPA
jgi:hypothetical protein